MIATNRITQYDVRRLEMQDGFYMVAWIAGPAGRVGEIRDWRGDLVAEVNEIPTVRASAPVIECRSLPLWVVLAAAAAMLLVPAVLTYLVQRVVLI